MISNYNKIAHIAHLKHCFTTKYTKKRFIVGNIIEQIPGLAIYDWITFPCIVTKLHVPIGTNIYNLSHEVSSTKRHYPDIIIGVIEERTNLFLEYPVESSRFRLVCTK